MSNPKDENIIEELLADLLRLQELEEELAQLKEKTYGKQDS